MKCEIWKLVRLSVDNGIGVVFSQKELTVIVASLSESLQKAEKLSKKWPGQLMGNNPFVEVIDGINAIINKTNEAIQGEQCP